MHNNNVSLHINIVHNTPLTPPLSNDVHKSAKLLASYFQLLVSSSESQLLSPFYCILPDMGSREAWHPQCRMHVSLISNGTIMPEKKRPKKFRIISRLAACSM